jgi:hypothetical protein
MYLLFCSTKRHCHRTLGWAGGGGCAERIWKWEILSVFVWCVYPGWPCCYSLWVPVHYALLLKCWSPIVFSRFLFLASLHPSLLVLSWRAEYGDFNLRCGARVLTEVLKILSVNLFA